MTRSFERLKGVEVGLEGGSGIRGCQVADMGNWEATWQAAGVGASRIFGLFG